METRFNIGLNGQTADLVNTLVEHGYKPKEVIYDALSVFDFAIQEIAAGKQFGSLDADKRTMNTVVTPILQQVRKNPEWLARYLGAYPLEESGASKEERAASA